MIKLSQNENPLGPSERVRDAMRAAIEDLGRYPSPDGAELAAAIAAHYDIAPERVLLGNGSGSISLLLLIAQTVGERGAKVLCSANGYVDFIFGHMQRDGVLSATIERVPRRERGHDLERIQRICEQGTVGLVILENPDNPTGAFIDDDRLSAFLDALPPEVLVVMDGAYAEYAAHRLGARYPADPALCLRHPSLIQLRTFSKAYALAGLRVGYALGAAGRIAPLARRRVKLSIGGPAIAAAAAALSDQAHLARTLALNAAGIAELEAGLDALGLRYLPSVANFILFSPQPADAAGVAAGLRDEGVLVFPLAPYGLPTELRVTTGTAEQNRRFLDALGLVLGIH